MPKKRTREQKIRTQYHYAMPVGRSFTGQLEAPVKKTQDTLSLYAYDPAYVIKDIRWTVIVSLFILAAQMGLYFWLK